MNSILKSMTTLSAILLLSSVSSAEVGFNLNGKKIICYGADNQSITLDVSHMTMQEDRRFKARIVQV